jgi:two-component system, OmpR family, response regulator ChvI
LSTGDNRKKRILIVDDEKDITTTMKKGLEEFGGYEVDAFNDPEQALSLFKPDHYDLLALDVRMPKLNGFQLYKQLQRIDPKPRVCFITAFELYYDEFRKVFPSLDVRCFIRKPVSMTDLVKEVNAEFEAPPQPSKIKR